MFRKDRKQKFGKKAAGMLLSMVLLPVIFALALSVKKAYASYYLLDIYTVNVENGYLALRSEKAYEKENEIGKLYSGDLVIECPTCGDESEYRYVYSPRLQKLGYVNASFINYYQDYPETLRYIYVEPRGSVLCTEEACESSTEIVKLHMADPVIVLDDSDEQYWLVYAPSFYTAGYVDSNYIVSSFSEKETDRKTPSANPVY